MTSLIKTAQPFTDPEDWRRMLATLPETVLLSMVAEKSRNMDIPWLNMMVEDGLLDMHEPLGQVTSVNELIDVAEAWGDRLKAFTDFMTGIEIQTVDNLPNPDYDQIPSKFEFASFTATEGMQTLYVAAHAVVQRNAQALRDHPLVRKDAPVPFAQQAVTQWLAGAIVLDLPDLIPGLLKASPEIDQSTFPLTSLGAAMARQAVVPDNTMSVLCDFKVSPGMAALALSRNRCLDALWEYKTPTRVFDAPSTHVFGIRSTLQGSKVKFARPKGRGF